MADLVDIAIRELGNTGTITGTPGSAVAVTGNNNKYGAFTGTNGLAWCSAFVSWCANEAGILNTLVPKTAAVSVGFTWYNQNNRFGRKGEYTPKRNDIVYFLNGMSHVGIVECVTGNMVQTIEGNTANTVARRRYPLTHDRITGYGKVADFMPKIKTAKNSTPVPVTPSVTTSDKAKTASTTDDSTEKAKQELAYLKSFLKRKEPKQDTSIQQYSVKSIKPTTDLEVLLYFVKNNKRYKLTPEDGMTVAWERKGAPGKLEFKCQVNKYKMQLGNAVCLYVNKKAFFYGYIFTLKPDEDGRISVTVYDQLRYFKNKDTYHYKKLTATKLLKMICNDYGLQLDPKIVNTRYAITRSESNKTLFDIFENNAAQTSYATGNYYTLYDDFGKLKLKTPWKVPILIDNETGQGYNYTTSIDSDVYNQIKLVYENKETGKAQFYVTKSTKTQNKWGILQYYEKIDNPMVAKLKGKVLLDMYNRATKTLSIDDCFGSTKVRAGCLVPVIMNLYDTKVSNFLLVDKVTHKFSNQSHTMNLELSGGAFDTSE